MNPLPAGKGEEKERGGKPLFNSLLLYVLVMYNEAETS